MRSSHSIAIAMLIIVSGILTAGSGLSLLSLPNGSIRDQNFMPVTGQALTFFVLGFVFAGVVIIATGVLFLVLPKWNVIPAGVVSVLSAIGLFGTVSSGILVIPYTMGVVGGLLGLFSRRLTGPWARLLPVSGKNWLSTFPFLLTCVGLWEFGGIFLGCGPPNGIGTGACDLLGAPFYIISMLGIASLLSLIAMPLWKALRHVHT